MKKLILLFLTLPLIKTIPIHHREIQLIDNCLNSKNYIVEKNSKGVILLSKHLAFSNCVQVNSYKSDNLKFVLFPSNMNLEPTVFYFESSNHLNITKNNTTMTVQEMDSDLVYTDEKTGKSIIYLKTNLTEIVFTISLEFEFISIEKKGHRIAGMWLDTHSYESKVQSFTFLDYIMLLLELFNIMIIVDVGLIVVLAFQRYNLNHEIHSKLMWLVLVFELLALCYFLWRYQYYFWSEKVFFYYFLASILINVFSIANTSVGVFLLTAIFEKHISQNVPVIKLVHRFLGYISYLLMKLSLIVKFFIFVFVVGISPRWPELAIVATNPVLWLLFWIYKIIKYYNKLIN